MNQILYTTEGKPKGPLPIKTIVKFFAFCIIGLGAIFIGEGTYSLISNDSSKNTIVDNTVPVIEFAKDGNNAVVSIKHNKGIYVIKYKWNDGEETIVRGNSKNEFVISDLNIPAGTSTLNVTAIDDNNKSASSSFEYTYDGIAIELSIVNNSDIKIIASDTTRYS